MTEATLEAPPAKALNGPMLTAAVVSAISGLLYGYDTGIISGALPQVSNEFYIGNGTKQTIAAGILLGEAALITGCGASSPWAAVGVVGDPVEHTRPGPRKARDGSGPRAGAAG